MSAASDRDLDTNPDGMPSGSDGGPVEQVGGREDDRSDIEQAVDARRDALDRGEGGDVPDGLTDDLTGATGGAGGRVRNQDEDAQ